MSTVKTAKDLLIAARALIEDPSRWTTHSYAKDRDGHSVAEFSGQACKWCAAGALSRAIYDCEGKYEFDQTEASNGAWSAIHRASHLRFNHQSVITVNDQLGHEAVLQVYDDAIARVA